MVKAVKKKVGKKKNPMDIFSGKKQLNEREVLLLKRRLNDGKLKLTEVKFPAGGFKLTKDQTKKGLDWLMNKWRTPSGVERKNNPFGPRVMKILENFKEFRLTGFNMSGTKYNPYFYPIYMVKAKNGDSFKYYVDRGEPSMW